MVGKPMQKLTLLLIPLVGGMLASAADRSFATWSEYLGGADLEVAWTYPTGPGTYTFDPRINDGVMYVLAHDRNNPNWVPGGNVPGWGLIVPGLGVVPVP